MTFRTITTFEKSGEDIVQLVHSVPGMEVVRASFVLGDNPYVESMQELVSTDNSYVEYHINFHDEASYLSWHDQWKTTHDAPRASAFVLMQINGVAIKRYWETTDLALSGSLPIENFVSKIV